MCGTCVCIGKYLYSHLKVALEDGDGAVLADPHLVAHQCDQPLVVRHQHAPALEL